MKKIASIHEDITFDSNIMAKGNANRSAGRLVDAANEYYVALNEYPSNQTILKKLIGVLIDIGDFKKALYILSKSEVSNEDKHEIIYIINSHINRENNIEIISELFSDSVINDIDGVIDFFDLGGIHGFLISESDDENIFVDICVNDSFIHSIMASKIQNSKLLPIEKNCFGFFIPWTKSNLHEAINDSNLDIKANISIKIFGHNGKFIINGINPTYKQILDWISHKFDAFFYRSLYKEIHHLSIEQTVRDYIFFGPDENRVIINIEKAIAAEFNSKNKINIHLLNKLIENIKINKCFLYNKFIDQVFLTSKEVFAYYIISLDIDHNIILDIISESDDLLIFSTFNPSKKEIINISIDSSVNDEYIKYINESEKYFIDIFLFKKEYIDDNNGLSISSDEISYINDLDNLSGYRLKNIYPESDLYIYADANPDIKIEFGGNESLYNAHYRTHGMLEARGDVMHGLANSYWGESILHGMLNGLFDNLKNYITISRIDDYLIMYSRQILKDYKTFDNFIVSVKKNIKMLLCQVYISRTTEILIIGESLLVFEFIFRLINDSRIMSFNYAEYLAYGNTEMVLDTINFGEINILKQAHKSRQESNQKVVIINGMSGKNKREIKLNNDAVDMIRSFKGGDSLLVFLNIKGDFVESEEYGFIEYLFNSQPILTNSSKSYLDGYNISSYFIRGAV